MAVVAIGADADVPIAVGVVPRRRFVRTLLRDRNVTVGLALVLSLCFAGIFAPVLSPYDPNAVNVVLRFQPPSGDFLLGTDHLGRDTLSRLLHGARLSMISTFVATAAISFIAVTVGLVSGYFGGVVDAVVSRVVEVALTVPGLLLALAITAALGSGLHNVVIAIVLVSWAGYARIVRSAVLAEREKDYVEAARATAVPTRRILFRHVLPNVVGPIVVMTTLELSTILLSISALSFLGLGVQPPTAEWGSMLNEGRAYLSRAPNMMLFPGLAIFLVVIGFNLVGDGLRDVLDPRTGEDHSLEWGKNRRFAWAARPELPGSG